MTPGKQQCRCLRITILDGDGTGTLTPEWVLCRWVRVIPVAETDSYDVTLKDGEGHIIIKRTGQVGTFSENLILSMGILRTVLIENAFQDGTFTFKADLH